MLIACWSTKGGVGTTVVAAILALHLAQKDSARVLAVDLDGDLAPALGAAPPGADGMTDWLAVSAEARAGALPRLAQPVAPGLRLVGRGQADWQPGLATPEHAQALAGSAQHVVIDCGRADVNDPLVDWLLATSDQSLQVVRLCYLTLRRAQVQAAQPTGVVLVAEAGRALGSADVARVMGAPVIAEIAMDRAVSRAVDAGLLASRLPRGLGSVFDGIGQGGAGQ